MSNGCSMPIGQLQAPLELSADQIVCCGSTTRTRRVGGRCGECADVGGSPATSAACRRAAAWCHPFPGILLTGYRRSSANSTQPAILPSSAPAHSKTAIKAITFLRPTNHPRHASGVDDTAGLRILLQRRACGADDEGEDSAIPNPVLNVGNFW